MDNVEMFESEEFPGVKETDVAAFIDPRTASQGVRILCAEGSFEFDSEETITSSDPSQYYDKFRMSIGLLESAKEMGSQFPLNINLHQLNAVSFSKGCYLGQELTQRTYHTGVVRRVALPFVVDSLPRQEGESLRLNANHFSPLEMVDTGFDEDLANTEIKDAKGKKLGKVLASANNLGIALVDLARLNANGVNHEYTLEG